MSEALVGLPDNPFNVALGIDRPFTPVSMQNAFAMPGDVAQANAIAPVLGGAPPPVPGELAAIQLPTTGGTVIQRPTVDGLGSPNVEKQYWTGTDLVDLGDPNPVTNGQP